MRNHLICAVASLALTIGLANAAHAQAGDSEPQKRPAEKSEPMKPAAKPAEQRADEGKPAQARPDQRAEDAKPADAMRPRDESKPERKAGMEKRAEDKKAVEEDNAAKRIDGTKAAQGDDSVRREREQQVNKEVQKDTRKDLAEDRAHENNVKVMGDLRISNERAAKITQQLRDRARPEKIDFEVQVGRPLPETVVLLPLPADIIAIAPEYRGYDYVYANNEIVFVQPTTHAVVGMIQVAGDTVADADADAQAPHIDRAKPCPVD